MMNLIMIDLENYKNKKNLNNNTSLNEETELPFQKVSSPNENNIPIKEGVNAIFEQSPELANIGTQQQYSEYLDTIFKDSKVKDIVYHGSSNIFKEFDESLIGKNTSRNQKGIFFTPNKKIADYLYQGSFEEVFDENGFRSKQKINDGQIISALINLSNIKLNENYVKEKDSIDEYDYEGLLEYDAYIVKLKSEIHILGNKQDIERFNNWVREDVYSSDDRDDQGDGSEQDELGYIEEQNDDTKDFIDQNDLSLLSEEDIIINNKINDLLDNGDIIQYCQ